MFDHIAQSKGRSVNTAHQIAEFRQAGRHTLNEAVSKQLLADYGIPVVRETVLHNADEACRHAAALGFPVVLKGVGDRLTHKTERNLVHIGLDSADAVREAFAAIRTAGGDDWQGCLLQPMVVGRRELVAGLFRDAQFGPVVMFGLGGIFTEAIGDVVFRIAPIDERQALQMAEELTAAAILEAFRGEAAVDRDQLATTLTGLSRLAMDHPQIAEVDINPLIVGADGRLTAVDALVVLTAAQSTPDPASPAPEARRQDAQAIIAALDRMCRPRSIAVVGASRPKPDGFPGMYGCIRNFGFPGNLYPINPNTPEIDGVQTYPDLVSLPEPVDLVVISVPGPRVPAALRDCVASGNQRVHIFSSGFKETGEPEGIRLQEELAAIAAEGALHVVGPNCMGIHVPASRLLTWVNASDISGPLAFVSQSGGHAQDFCNIAVRKFGLHFSKVFSYGNALTLDSTDFLAYLAQDDETRIIAMYLEGVKDGRLLREQVTAINRTKPIVILKGGMTASGARTVASHTGSMAGGEKIWRAFFRQTGAVPVATLDEMAEVAAALHYLPPCHGRNVAILGTGGGIGVAAADSCSRVGLALPALTDEMMQQLRRFIPPAGNMIRNPIDAHIVLLQLELLGPTLQLLAQADDLDMFVLSLHLDWLQNMEAGAHIDKIAAFVAHQARQYLNGKPLVVAWRQYQPNPAIQASRERLEATLKEAGVPVYEGLDRALSALAKTAAYHAFQKTAAGQSTSERQWDN
nr:acetate--CoA ligase family protein [Desulfatitalea alkaliphila]